MREGGRLTRVDGLMVYRREREAREAGCEFMRGE